MRLKESLKSVLTPARHGTMCERKPRDMQGGRNTFQKQWHCSSLFMKRTQKLCCYGVFGNKRLPNCHRCWLTRVFASSAIGDPCFSFTNSLLLFQNNPYSHSVFWRVGPVIAREIRGAVTVVFICVW